MNMEIISTSLSLDLHGFSGTAFNKDYAGTAFKLMDKMWQIVKANHLPNKGLNIWVFDENEKVFAGIELIETPKFDTGLERKTITLNRYAYYKHIGPYNLVKQAGQNMTNELKNRGEIICNPYIEIYGHWTNDESKLETELFMCLE